MSHLPLTLLRELDLREPSDCKRPAFLAAASGLVQRGDYLYVVADDEYHLGVFTHDHTQAGELVALFDGVLPAAPAERKALKPDLEALVVLPAFAGYPQGALLGVGSGSKQTRLRGVVLGLDAEGAINTLPYHLDWSAVYATLSTTFADLNIEGAFISGDTLNLLQRGNQSDRTQNARVEVALAAVFAAIHNDQPVSPAALGTMRVYDLGKAAGVPLTFTDAASLPDGSWVFTAVAEATDNSYLDGACVGAAIGVIDRADELICVQVVDACYKIEGIAASVQDDQVHLLLVTDADDPNTPASLLSATLVGYPFSSSQRP